MTRGPSKTLPQDQEQFEGMAIELICLQNPDLAEIIRDQWSNAELSERWGSGIGFFVNIEVPVSSRKLDIARSRELTSYDLLIDVGYPMDTKIADILGYDDDIRKMEGAMLELHHDGQTIHLLECVSFATSGEWPTEKYDYRVLISRDNEPSE
jgi:hypothetical protein